MFILVSHKILEKVQNTGSRRRLKIRPPQRLRGLPPSPMQNEQSGSEMQRPVQALTGVKQKLGVSPRVKVRNTPQNAAKARGSKLTSSRCPRLYPPVPEVTGPMPRECGETSNPGPVSQKCPQGRPSVVVVTLQGTAEDGHSAAKEHSCQLCLAQLPLVAHDLRQDVHASRIQKCAAGEQHAQRNVFLCMHE